MRFLTYPRYLGGVARLGTRGDIPFLEKVEERVSENLDMMFEQGQGAGLKGRF